MKRQPKGIPTGGQFAQSALPESTVRLVTIPASEHVVQADPLLADYDALRQVAPDGTLTTVVEVAADDWDGADSDARADLLAATQWAHSDAVGVDHEVLAYNANGDESTYVVKVTNSVSDWVADEDAVDAYNASVAPGYALTPEKIAFLTKPGFADAQGRRAVKDLDGYDVIWAEDGPARVTPCCGASATGTADYIGCRACYEPVDDAIGMHANLVQKHSPWVNWTGGNLEPDEERRAIGGIAAALKEQQKIVAGGTFKPRTWEDQVVVMGPDGLVSTHLDSAWSKDLLWGEPGGMPSVNRPDPPDGRVLAKVSHDGRVDTSVIRGGMTCLRQRTDGRFEHWPNQKLERHQCQRNADCRLLDTHPGDCVTA